MHLGKVLGWVRRQRAVQLAQRLCGRQRLRPLDHLALQLAPHVALELLEPVARHGIRIGQRGALLLALQPERAPDALNIHADHAGALALAPERGDRESREVAHLAVRAGPDRLADALAQGVEVELLATLEALLSETLLDRLALDRPEEEAVEQHVEHVPVLLRLRERRAARRCPRPRLRCEARRRTPAVAAPSPPARAPGACRRRGRG